MLKVASFGAVLGFVSLGGASVQADLPPGRCSTVVQFEPYIGDRCRTFEGAIFTLIRDPRTQETGWRNERTGQVWFEAVAKGVDQFEALEYCASKLGHVLPTAEPGAMSDFTQGAADGIVELFPVMRDYAMWSSTLSAADGTEAYVFAGKKAEIASFARHFKNKVTAAICVSGNL